MPTLTPYIWFDGDLEPAIEFYSTIFADAEVTGEQRMPDGSLLGATFVLAGQTIQGLNGGPGHPHTDAFSLFLSVKGQDEVDHYWDALLAGGGYETSCGWLVDRFGLAWQVIPEELGAAMSNPDPEKAGYAVQAMLRQKKIVISELTQG
ncbi:MAG TPA: VOC family protein [Pseudolysinimonas sp.]|nr:VOC family protein [Pseudolysinimonas sp.]